MTKIIFPGVVLPTEPIHWEILDIPTGTDWGMQIFLNGAPLALTGGNMSGTVDSTGVVSRTTPALAAGAYEVQFAFETGEEKIIPLQSIAKLEFIWLPDYNSRVTKKPVVQEVKFGDGYEQAFTFGINPNREEWDLNFSELHYAEAMQIDLFLTSMAGTKAFLWKSPTGRVLRFKCPDHSRNFVDDDVETINARFVQVFL